MTSLRVDILNPKAEKLLKNLEDLKLISIKQSTEPGFLDVLQKLRAKTKKKPSLSVITEEVESVRSKRYGR